MYSAQLLDHFQHPRNAGEIAHPDAVAEIENPACGDVLRISLKTGLRAITQAPITGVSIAHASINQVSINQVSINQVSITQVKFKAKGCVAAIACGSALTELVEGKTAEQARKLTGEDVIAAVGGLPKGSTHAAQLALDALAAALGQLRV